MATHPLTPLKDPCTSKSNPSLGRLVTIYERERQLLVYDLHDGVAQDLAAALSLLEASHYWQTHDSGRAQDAWEQGLELLREGLAETRRLLRGLQPPVLDELGLVAALEQLVQERRLREGPTIEFSCDLEPIRRPRIFENGVYRIVQESLTNAWQHSHSTTIRLDLNVCGDELLLEVRDWGVGFEMRRVPPGRLGLRSIQQRAQMLGGCATITSIPGEGTCVAVQLPLLVEAVPEEP